MITQIKQDIKTAMRNKDIVKRDVLKMVLNKANLLAKDSKLEEPNTNMVLDAIKKESKQNHLQLVLLRAKNRKWYTCCPEEDAMKFR